MNCCQYQQNRQSEHRREQHFVSCPNSRKQITHKNIHPNTAGNKTSLNSCQIAHFTIICNIWCDLYSNKSNQIWHVVDSCHLFNVEKHFYTYYHISNANGQILVIPSLYINRTVKWKIHCLGILIGCFSSDRNNNTMFQPIMLLIEKRKCLWLQAVWTRWTDNKWMQYHRSQ